MSVFKRPHSQYYQYDFVIGGHRFYGSTKAATKKEALSDEIRIREKAKADIAEAKATGQGPLTIRYAAGRYWNEVGQYHANATDTFRALERLATFFGPDKRMSEISDGDVSALIAWRRAQKRWGKDQYKDERKMETVSPATVNRDTTAVLKRLFMRARKKWKIQLPNEPEWKEHWLKEAEERVRELHQEEGEALDTAVREDYAPWLEFARLTGLRLAETLIRWKNVNWFARTITTTGKGGRTVTAPITKAVRELLEPLKGQHDEWVFTYVAKRTNKKDKKVRGERYPITYEGAKTEWQRTRVRSKVEDFRFHDIRHDIGTKTLRQTGNLKITQRVLNHTSLKTTSRYAHVLDEEVSAALDSVADSRRTSRSNKKDTA